MTRSLICFALILSSFSIYAQDSKVKTVAETSKVKNIRTLLEISGSGKLGVQVTQTIASSRQKRSTSFWYFIIAPSAKS